nr:hypothetical protein Itr_chr13CG16010 [Ipomoea trifida]
MAKYAARLGQSFESSRETSNFDKEIVPAKEHAEIRIQQHKARCSIMEQIPAVLPEPANHHSSVYARNQR